MSSPARERALRAALKIGREIGDSRVLTDPEVIARYAQDESEAPAAMPDAVILPQSTDEACTVMRVTSEQNVPVTPRAGGTGKSGGAVPVSGGIVLSCERLHSIREIDPVDMVAVVEPGVVLARFHEAVEDQGLFYPPDPASLDSCCLGGNVAENAGGPRAFKYGVTSHYVLGLTMVLADGRPVRLGHRPVKSVAGYDLVRLLVGSEGTLGFFTDITLRLLPRPAEISTVVALFGDLEDAGRAITALLGTGLVPRVLEIMDAQCVDTIRHSGASIPADASAMVLVELDGPEQTVETQMQRCGDTLDAGGATEVLVASGPVQRDVLWRARRELSEALAKRATYKMSDDISIPRSRLVDTLSEIEAMGRRSGLTAATFGHAGDGNLHVNFLWDDPALAVKAIDVRRKVLDMAIRMGGSISGEHGIGSVKKDFLERELGADVMQLSRSLKQLFDPAGTMNPGKVL